MSNRLTPAMKRALARRSTSKWEHLTADPRTLRALFDRGLAMREWVQYEWPDEPLRSEAYPRYFPYGRAFELGRRFAEEGYGDS